MESKKFNLDEELANCRSIEDLCGKDGLVQKLIGGMIENMLEQEMNEHLGYEKHASEGKETGNSRNGKQSKTVKSSYGSMELEVPRDRNAEFSPQVIKKGQRSINAFDEKVLSMYARGMSTRDIQCHIEEIYGCSLSPAAISHITEKVVEAAKEWQVRPLEKVYPIAYFDAIHFKVKEQGKVVSKAAYTCLAIDLEGKKEILGLWIGESEGAKFWLNIFTELKNRGVEDIFIACVDGLKGMADAIHAVFPETSIQLCVIHLIRNSIKYLPHKHTKEYMGDLKPVYKAVTQQEAERHLEKLQEKWEKKYPLAVRPWVTQWENIKTYFQFPEEIRKIIYTTNAVESLHRQFRKVTKNRGAFPSDESLLKLLYLTVTNLSKSWSMPVKGWKNALSQFAIIYGTRMQLGC